MPLAIESRMAAIKCGIPQMYMTGNQQHKKWAFLLLVFVLMLSAGCGDKVPTNAGKTSPAGDKAGANKTLRVVFKWPGDDFASRQDLEIRDKIGDLIRERGVGKIIRAGTGMGWMDLLILVKDKDNAIPELKSIIEEIGPDLNFTIEDMKRTS